VSSLAAPDRTGTSANLTGVCRGRVDDALDQRSQLAQSIGPFLIVIVAIVDAFNASDRMSEDPLRNVRQHACPLHECLRGATDVVDYPRLLKAKLCVQFLLAQTERIECPVRPDRTSIND
jgi:hypothetical protein